MVGAIRERLKAYDVSLIRNPTAVPQQRTGVLWGGRGELVSVDALVAVSYGCDCVIIGFDTLLVGAASSWSPSRRSDLGGRWRQIQW